MKVWVNSELIEIAQQGHSIGDLLAELGLDITGCALAVNEVIVSRTEWDSYALSENDRVSVFQVIAGG